MRVVFTLLIVLCAACGNAPAPTNSAPIPTFNAGSTLAVDPVEPDPVVAAIPTSDARSPEALCFDANRAWGSDWAVVVDALVRMRDQGVRCNDQDPALLLYPAYYNYGVWLEGVGRIEEAIFAYRAALDAKPDGSEAAQALIKHSALTPPPPEQCPADLVADRLASVPPYTPHGSGDYVRIQDSAFVLNDKPYLVRGVNYYPVRAPWRRFLTETDITVMAKELDLIASVGFNTIRVFLWYDALFDCPGSGVVPVPEAFARVDTLFKLAAERGLRVLVTLNDLPDLMIRPLYTFPDIPAAQTTYIVQRYRDEPAIFAWDLRNEGDIDYVRGYAEYADVVTWLAGISSLVRGLDPNHLITAGWLDNPRATEPHVDFLSFHHWRGSDALLSRLDTYREYSAKPLLMQEVGYSTYGGGEAAQARRLAEVLPAAENDGAAGWLIWTAFDFPTDVTCIPPACPSRDNGEHHYGLWRTDYTPKPAVEVIAGLIGGTPGDSP
jgi:tetratricopeptide (TPR) repeat protein